jgi:hypothetical protein
LGLSARIINSLSPSLSVTIHLPYYINNFTFGSFFGAAINAVAIKTSSVSIFFNCLLISFDVLLFQIPLQRIPVLPFFVVCVESQNSCKTNAVIYFMIY